MTTAVYCLFFVAGLAIFISMLKTKRFVSALIFSALQGIIALFAANFIGDFANMNISVNTHTLILSAVGGIPGVIFLLICGALFR